MSLCITRKAGQSFRAIFDGKEVTIKTAKVVGNRVRFHIDAPPEVKILRSELATEAQGEAE